jgi:hypothetical protein
MKPTHAPFYSKVIAANARDATYVLDGLLYHESDLRVEEHYTDTAGFTDHVLALCHLLGFRFPPRIRDWPTNDCTPNPPPHYNKNSTGLSPIAISQKLRLPTRLLDPR